MNLHEFAELLTATPLLIGISNRNPMIWWVDLCRVALHVFHNSTQTILGILRDSHRETLWILEVTLVK